MALKDKLTNDFLDKAHKRWRIDINADDVSRYGLLENF